MISQQSVSVGLLRRGVTLLELIIVVAILSILAALTAAASMRVASAQPQRNTESLIRRLIPVLESHWQAAIDEANTEKKPASMSREQFILSSLTQEFPMNFREAEDRYDAHVRGAARGNGESACCLYVALSRARGGRVFEPEAALGAKFLAPCGSTQMIIDGWGRPIYFFRVPPTPNNPYGEPVVISAGADGNLGFSSSNLGDPNESPAAYDNIDSRTLR